MAQWVGGYPKTHCCSPLPGFKTRKGKVCGLLELKSSARRVTLGVEICALYVSGPAKRPSEVRLTYPWPIRSLHRGFSSVIQFPPSLMFSSPLVRLKFLTSVMAVT